MSYSNNEKDVKGVRDNKPIDNNKTRNGVKVNVGGFGAGKIVTRDGEGGTETSTTFSAPVVERENTEVSKGKEGGGSYTNISLFELKLGFVKGVEFNVSLTFKDTGANSFILPYATPDNTRHSITLKKDTVVK